MVGGQMYGQSDGGCHYRRTGRVCEVGFEDMKKAVKKAGGTGEKVICTGNAPVKTGAYSKKLGNEDDKGNCQCNGDCGVFQK